MDNQTPVSDHVNTEQIRYDGQGILVFLELVDGQKQWYGILEHLFTKSTVEITWQHLFVKKTK
ncbi:hypothetical protein DD238_004539 [Peronospora effusa]|uniref:Uncharacterized protein n=1 Tax=Peronospora effusa TaxID=542832 RepID=A0A3M6VK48_9STRA|nr:hypothetical protein DD238_004539 [Peronospora effusa]RQM09435.1 hypothetical protein DD237_007487 [Peronospora effusa]